MRPRGPNEKIIAIAVVNGGETSGSSTARVDRGRSQRGRPRARRREREEEAERACPPTPTSVASSRLFQNARSWLRSVSDREAGPA